MCLLLLGLVLTPRLWAMETIESVLDRYIAEGLENNLALKRQQFDLDAALAALDEARALRLPNVTLNARYSRNEGGRVTELPIGQLVNPAYQAINRLLAAQGQPANFPVVADQSIEFLRARDQDTRISVTAPLYAPAIPAAIRAQRGQLSSASFARIALARRLVRDITVAYLNWLKAREAVAIVAASEALLTENLRVNNALLGAGKVTRDRSLRAEAELLAVKQLKREAENQRAQAAHYFNFLLNRELDTGIDLASDADAEPLNPPRSAKQGSKRPELDALASQVGALDALVDVARAEFSPKVSVALDSGIQGERYDFGPGNNFTSLSVVFSFNVFDGGARAARVRQASAQRAAAASQLDELRAQIALECKSADDDLAAAFDSLATARARVAAASAAFEIARRKRDAGVLPAIEFIDSRSALTAAELNASVTRFDVLARAAQRDYARAERPLPRSFSIPF